MKKLLEPQEAIALAYERGRVRTNMEGSNQTDKSLTWYITTEVTLYDAKYVEDDEGNMMVEVDVPEE